MNPRGENHFLAPRFRELIVQLGLEAHPEGVDFRRIRASEVEVVPQEVSVNPPDSREGLECEKRSCGRQEIESKVFAGHASESFSAIKL
jgi:hypothetical protein